MANSILRARGPRLVAEPEAPWRRALESLVGAPSSRLSFMTEDHHRVRDTAVRELPRHDAPLEPSFLAERTGVRLDRTESILEELESRLFFLVRDEGGRVLWAYPGTRAPTPHRLRFDTEETVQAA